MRKSKIKYLKVFLITFSVVLWGANLPINKITDIEEFDVDVLGNIYTVSNDIITAYDKDLIKQASFSDFSLGEITSFEAEDALNIMLFYANDKKIVFLDNNLNIKRSAIDIADMGYEETSLAAGSYNTGFWIYDPIQMNVLRFNRLLENTNSTGNLQQILGETINPQKLRETNNMLILSDSVSGVFLFDRYGAFIRKIPIKHIVDFQLNENKISLLKSDSLFFYDIKTLHIDTLLLKYKNIVKFKHLSRKYYYLNAKGELSIDIIP